MSHGSSRKGACCASCLRRNPKPSRQEVRVAEELQQLVRAAGLLCDARSSRYFVEPLLELCIERPLRMILEQVLGCPSSFVFVASFGFCLLAVLFAPHLSLSFPPQPGVSARLAPGQCHVTCAQQPSCSDYAKAAMRDLG